MNIQQLEYIAAVDRYKSFSKAADACYITQATLSTMVKKLEEELDIILFDRSINPVKTTDAGREIINESLKILAHTTNIKEIASNLQNKVQGDVYIGIIPTISANLLPRILPYLLSTYPDLNFHFQEITTNTLIQKIKNGELDMGILSTPLFNNDLNGHVLYFERLMVYGNLDKKINALIPEDMMNHEVWLLQEGHCLRDQIINLCDIKTSNIKQNLFFQPNTFDALLNLVDKFGGLTLIPELYFNDLPDFKKAKVIQFKYPQPVREISLVFQRPFVKQNIIKMLTHEIKTIVNTEISNDQIEFS